jgi:hypothetical protein
MTAAHLSRESLEEGRLSKTGTGSPEEDHPAVAPVPQVQVSLQTLKGLLVDIIDKLRGLPTEDLKSGAERVS